MAKATKPAPITELLAANPPTPAPAPAPAPTPQEPPAPVPAPPPTDEGLRNPHTLDALGPLTGEPAGYDVPHGEEQPSEDLTIGELMARAGHEIPTDQPTPMRSAIIREMEIGDIEPGAELPPPPVGYTAKPLEPGAVAMERPKQQMSYSDFVNSGYDRTALAESKVPEPPKPLPIDSDGVRYESRIRISRAWAYEPRGLQKAPEYVDRNWLAYDGPDELRGMPASPVLKVPTGSGLTVCRPGDVIVLQEVLLDESRSYREVEVWSREQFERMFIASSRSAPAVIDA